MTRISLLAWRPKGVLWDAEEREYLTLQVREWHVEDLHGTRAFDQLVALREEDLLSLRNFGRKSLDEIKEKLVQRGFLTPDELTKVLV